MIAETYEVGTGNVPVVAPAATKANGSIGTLELLALSGTDLPPAGAGPLNVTVPVEGLPPMTEFGLRVNPTTSTPWTVSLAVTLTDAEVAVMVAVANVVAWLVVRVNVVLVAPAGTSTCPGTAVDGSLLCRVTKSPPAGAADARVTVPVELDPLETVLGFNVNPLRATVLA